MKKLLFDSQGGLGLFAKTFFPGFQQYPQGKPNDKHF